jgi:hypothetical protein
MLQGKPILSKNKRKNSEIIDFTDGSMPILTSIMGSNVGDFMTNFKRNPYVIKGNDRILSALKDQLGDFNVETMLESSASDNYHVWLKQTSNHGNKLESIIVEDASHALKLYNAGHSLYCRAPKDLEDIVISRCLKELNFSIGCSNSDRYRRGEIETFYSNKGHLTAFHTDFQENITIMLTGKKKWRFINSSLTHPLRGCTPHYYQSNDVAETQLKVLKLSDSMFSVNEYINNKKNKPYEVIIEAGDILYHPAGIWHEVECIENSISINISLVGVTYAEVVSNAIQQLLLQNDKYREIVNVSHQKNALQVIQNIFDEIQSIVTGKLVPNDILTNHCFVKECDPVLYISKFNSKLSILANKLRINPLASLLLVNELKELGWSENTDEDETSSTSSASSSSSLTAPSYGTLVVHINYGNESYESLIRAEIRCDSTDQATIIYNQWLKWKQNNKVVVEVDKSGEICRVINCLLHVGVINCI